MGGGGGSPSYDQDAFRFRNDDGSETTATWLAALNTNATLDVDTNYRLRFLVQNVGTAAGANIALQFQYNHNGAGWVNVTTTSSVVRAVADANGIANDADCTQQLGAGTFWANNNGFTEDGLSGGAVLDLPNGQESETEICFQIVSADVADNDTIQLRLVLSGGTLLNSYTNTPTLTVNEAPAGISLDVTTSSTAQIMAASTTVTRSIDAASSSSAQSTSATTTVTCSIGMASAASAQESSMTTAVGGEPDPVDMDIASSAGSQATAGTISVTRTAGMASSAAAQATSASVIVTAVLDVASAATAQAMQASTAVEGAAPEPPPPSLASWLLTPSYGRYSRRH